MRLLGSKLVANDATLENYYWYFWVLEAESAEFDKMVWEDTVECR